MSQITVLILKDVRHPCRDDLVRIMATRDCLRGQQVASRRQCKALISSSGTRKRRVKFTFYKL